MTTTVVLHSGPVANVPGAPLTASIVGSPPQWDDNDDTTYARVETTTAPQSSSAYAPFDPLPASTEVQAVRITVRYSTSYPSGTLPTGDPRVINYEFWRDYADGTYVWRQQSDGIGHPDVYDDDLINEFAYTLFPASWMSPDDVAYYEPIWRSLLESGALLNFAAGAGGLAGLRHAYATIYKVTLEIDYVAAAGEFIYDGPIAETVTRLYPRDDTLGFSGPNRIYPPPRANRIVGRQP